MDNKYEQTCSHATYKFRSCFSNLLAQQVTQKLKDWTISVFEFQRNDLTWSMCSPEHSMDVLLSTMTGHRGRSHDIQSSRVGSDLLGMTLQNKNYMSHIMLHWSKPNKTVGLPSKIKCSHLYRWVSMENSGYFYSNTYIHTYMNLMKLLHRGFSATMQQ